MAELPGSEAEWEGYHQIGEELEPIEPEVVDGEPVLPQPTGIEWEEWSDFPGEFTKYFKLKVRDEWWARATPAQIFMLNQALEDIKMLAAHSGQ